jgi:hypothetical protein
MMGEFNEGYSLIYGMLVVAVIGGLAEVWIAVARSWHDAAEPTSVVSPRDSGQSGDGQGLAG